MKHIGIMGFGNMGEVFAVGLRRQKPDISIGIMEKEAEKAVLAEKTYGITRFLSPDEFFRFADLTILAVKPQDIPAVSKEVGNASYKRRIISIAAGTSIASIRNSFSTDEVVRFMPNLAAKVLQSVVGVSYGDTISEEFRRDALEIASAVGIPYELPEKLLSAVTGLSGSGIAYVFAFFHALALGGTKSGLRYNVALDIALKTVQGAVAVVAESNEHPISLLSKVISPAGTTIEGLQALEEGGFTATVMEAVENAARRAGELEL